jgi:hypothetical protein
MIKLPVPKQLVIGPHEYSVEFDHDIRMSDGHNGQISYRKKYIKLDPAEGQSERQIILLHEVLHGISDVFRVGLSEEDNDRVATGLVMFLRDNFGAEFTFNGLPGQ